MAVILVIGIIFALGIGFLIFYLIRSGVLRGKSAAAKNTSEKNENLQIIKTAKAAVESEPKNAEAHYNLGMALLAEGRSEQAFREFKSVSRLGFEGKNIPEIEFRQTIAKLYVQFKESEEGLKEYLLLIKNQPENPEYYFCAGAIFGSRNRMDLAENYYKKAISLNPKEAKYYVELGEMLYQEKKHREAGITLDEALRIDQNNVKALFFRGKALKDNKEYAEALRYFEKASRDQEFKVHALIESGSCYMSLKMTDRAIADLERAIKIVENEDGTDSLYARYFLGMCYEDKQEIPKAIEQYQKIYAKKKNFLDVGEKLIEYQENNQSK